MNWREFGGRQVNIARCNGRLISEKEISARLKESALRHVNLEDDPMRRKAAVLVPLLCVDGNWRLLFTRRTELVPHHKGQVSFPGGAFEDGDGNLVQTALRESCEEIGLRPKDVRILGELKGMPSVSNYMITPIVGRITKPFEIKLSPYEVSRVFTIPLAWLADENHREIRPYHAGDGRAFEVIYYDMYDGEVLWGATARMTVLFLQLLGLTR